MIQLAYEPYSASIFIWHNFAMALKLSILEPKHNPNFIGILKEDFRI